MTNGHGRPWRRSPAAMALAVLVMTGACSDSDDLSPAEPEADEEDSEIVPGEGGPVE